MGWCAYEKNYQQQSEQEKASFKKENSKTKSSAIA
jgi:hypothetical protein